MQSAECRNEKWEKESIRCKETLEVFGSGLPDLFIDGRIRKNGRRQVGFFLLVHAFPRITFTSSRLLRLSQQVEPLITLFGLDPEKICQRRAGGDEGLGQSCELG